MEQDNGTKQNIDYQAVDPHLQTADNYKLHEDLRTLAKFGARYEDLTFMQETLLSMILSRVAVITTNNLGDIELWRDIEVYAKQVTDHLEKRPSGK